MTAIRRSVLVAKESGDLGSGTPVSSQWYQIPPGAYITFTASRQAQSYYETGSKKRALTSWGQIAVQWTLTYLQDYTHLEMLDLFFEGYGRTPSTGTATTYTHKFYKKNGDMPTHFVFRVKQLDRNVGGPKNEITVLAGCVCKTLNTSVSSNGSQVNVSISGYAVVPKTTADIIDATDWSADTDDTPIQYTCAFLDDMDSDGYIGEVDQASCAWDNGANMVYSICSPEATRYYEGQNSYTFNISCYDNNMFKLKLRPNTGGGNALTSSSSDLSWKTKGLENCEHVFFASYSGVRVASEDISDTIADSDRSFIIKADGATMKSMTWQKGDGQKLQQSLSSVECDDMWIEVKNSLGAVWDDDHKVTLQTGGATSISDATLTVTATTYNGQLQTPTTVTLTKSGTTIPSNQYELTGNYHRNAGTYGVVATAKASSTTYVGSVDSTWTINKATVPTITTSFSPRHSSSIEFLPSKEDLYYPGFGKIRPDPDCVTISKVSDMDYTTAGSKTVKVTVVGDINFNDETTGKTVTYTIK